LIVNSRSSRTHKPLGPLGYQSTLEALDIPGGWAERTEVVGQHTFNLLAPADPNEFLNQLDENSDHHVADPYWSAIWSTAPKLAERILRHPWSDGTSALELGCGVGLAGLAALAVGVHVTFSDYIAPAVAVALENARLNGFSPMAAGAYVDWRNPPRGQTYSLVLGSDVLYEHELHVDLITTLDHVLADDGECWIGDPMRASADDFAQLARRRGYHVVIDRNVARREQVHGEGHGEDDIGVVADREFVTGHFDPTFQLLILRRAANDTGRSA